MRISGPLTAALLCAAEAGAVETASFLTLQPGARAAAMGDALAADARGLAAFTSNPSGLGLKAERQAGFSHAELFEDTRLDHAAYAQPLGEGGAAGLSVLRLSHARIDGRDASRAATGSFSAADTAASAVYARRAAPGLVAGAAVKYIDSQIADRHGKGVAADLGATWSREEGPLPFSLGAAALHLGPGLKFDRERDELPATLAAGAALKPAPGALAALELKHRPHGSGTSVHLGGEYAVIEALRLRAGYALRPGEDAGGASGLGAGFGLTLARVDVDYAFSPYGELGNAQRVSLTIRF